jgi:hypothetical protein
VRVEEARLQTQRVVTVIILFLIQLHLQVVVVVVLGRGLLMAAMVDLEVVVDIQVPLVVHLLLDKATTAVLAV